jgi:hypothetical protein
MKSEQDITTAISKLNDLIIETREISFMVYTEMHGHPDEKMRKIHAGIIKKNKLEIEFINREIDILNWVKQ